MTKDRTCLISDHDLKTMEEIGKFRAVTLEDLERFYYEGNGARMRHELRSLSQQGLLQQRKVMLSVGKSLRVVTISKAGKRLLEQERNLDTTSPRTNQCVYAGLKKIAEISHDVAIYRMYQAEAEKIRFCGGNVRRVVLDYELKKKVFSPLARARQVSPELYQKRQEEVARANGLVVVDGKIPLPDLRIEYETPGGEIEKVDLELATGHYKDSQLAEKSRAGFKLYIAGSSHSRGGSVWEERELTRGILSL